MILPTAARVCYHLTQQVTLVERETADATPVKESYPRNGLVLYTCVVENGIWKRRLEEYVLSVGILAIEVQPPKVSRILLLESHKKFMLLHRLRFGLETPIVVTSDLTNKTVGMPAQDHHAPFPYGCVYLPTLMPSFPVGPATVGQDWTGTIPVVFGAGEFTLRYDAKVKAVQRESVQVEVSFPAQAPHVSKNDITLRMVPTGAWMVTISANDGAPVEVKGSMHIRVQGEMKEGDLPLQQTDVLDCQLSFELRRIPVTFDKEFLYPGTWRPPAEPAAAP